MIIVGLIWYILMFLYIYLFFEYHWKLTFLWLYMTAYNSIIFFFFARCSYMFVFDSIYLNETLRFYDTSNWPGGEFKSISSAVFIGLCSRPNPPNITVKFNIDCEFFFLNFDFNKKEFVLCLTKIHSHVLRCWLNAKKKKL